MSVSTGTPTRNGGASGQAPAGPPPPQFRPGVGPAAAETKRRRNPAAIIVGILLIILGSLGAAVMVSSIGSTTNVVAVARDVPRGSVITEGDLAPASIVADPVLDPVSADQLVDLVGQRAQVDLSAGSLLTDGAVAPGVTPGDGEAVVGMLLPPGRLPDGDLVPGDDVRLIATPRSESEAPSLTAPPQLEASVLTSTPLLDALSDVATGDVYLDVIVDPADAPILAAWVATDSVSVVLDSREVDTPAAAPGADSTDGQDA